MMEPTKNRSTGTTPPTSGTVGDRGAVSSGASGNLVGEAKGLANQAVERARDLAKGQVSDRQEKSAGQIEVVAKALRRTSDDLGDSMAAPIVRRAAGILDDVTESLRTADLRSAVQSTERFARREPLLFIGGAFAVGLLAARFLKSSERREGEMRGAADQYDRQRQPYSPPDVFPSREIASPSASTGVTYGAPGDIYGGTRRS